MLIGWVLDEIGAAAQFLVRFEDWVVCLGLLFVRVGWMWLLYGFSGCRMFSAGVRFVFLYSLESLCWQLFFILFFYI